jgi:ligand-binding SRPBCC domain-containing protein
MRITIHSLEKGFLLESAMRLPRPRQEIFDFFSEAANLERITPERLRFALLTPLPIPMAEGTTIEYRILIRGLPVRWRTLIAVWEPPVRFVDEQQRGPYRWWRHEHRFIEEGETTLVEDRVDYQPPGGRLVNRLFVAPELRRIFQYRHDRLAELLG